MRWVGTPWPYRVTTTPSRESCQTCSTARAIAPAALPAPTTTQRPGGGDGRADGRICAGSTAASPAEKHRCSRATASSGDMVVSFLLPQQQAHEECKQQEDDQRKERQFKGVLAVNGSARMHLTAPLPVEKQAQQRLEDRAAADQSAVEQAVCRANGARGSYFPRDGEADRSCSEPNAGQEKKQCEEHGRKRRSVNQEEEAEEAKEPAGTNNWHSPTDTVGEIAGEGRAYGPAEKHERGVACGFRSAHAVYLHQPGNPPEPREGKKWRRHGAANERQHPLTRHGEHQLQTADNG